MTDQPDELSEARAELQQEDLSIVEEDSLTANTTTDNKRVEDERVEDERVEDQAPGPLTEQPDAAAQEG